MTLAQYIVDYIQEEVDRSIPDKEWEADEMLEMVKHAIDAYEGGAR